MNIETQPAQSKEGPDAILAIKDKSKRLNKIKNCLDESVLTQLAKKTTDIDDKEAIIANEFTPYDIAVKLGTVSVTLYPSLRKRFKSKDPSKAKPKEQRRIAAFACSTLRVGAPAIYLSLVKDICGASFHAPRSVRMKILLRNVTKTSNPLLYLLVKDFKDNVTEGKLLKNIIPPIITKLNKALIKRGIITAEQADIAAKKTSARTKSLFKKGANLGENIIDFHIKIIQEMSKKAQGRIKGIVQKAERAKSLLTKYKRVISSRYKSLKNFLGI